MALKEIILESDFSLVAHQPRHMVNGMIRIAEPAELSYSWRTDASSSLGHLDALPLEVLHMIFATLDFKTLSDLSKTCLRGIEVVRSLREYRALTAHAPRALAAMGKTGLIRHFSATTVYAALVSPHCVSCNCYGAFLFLPTCERCCYHCLWRNQSLWVIPVSLAKKCFGLSTAAARALPTMRSVPGTYHVKHTISRARPLDLVCVGAAKKLALAENRTEERLRQDLERERSAGPPFRDYHLLRFLQRAPMQPPGMWLCLQPTQSNVPSDMFCGMASLPFPYLAPGNDVEHGLWCLGCELVWRRWSPNDACPDHLAHLVRPGCHAPMTVYYMQEIARSKGEFLDHISSCPGAKELLEQHSAAAPVLSGAYGLRVGADSFLSTSQANG